MEKSIVKAEDVSVIFDGKPVLQHISFEVNRGDNLTIIGPNGSGKTVLLRALLGTVPYSGAIAWTSNVKRGYVPQKIEADRHLPVNARDLLTAKAHILKVSEKEIASITHSVGLTDGILKTPVGFLSGGQFQRALIALALVGNPDVVLFDEPTASVDVPHEEQIYELIHRLQDERGLTVIVVSHDLSFVQRYATKVLCINVQGICYGTPEEALNAEVLKKLYGSEHKLYHHIHPHHE